MRHVFCERKGSGWKRLEEDIRKGGNVSKNMEKGTSENKWWEAKYKIRLVNIKHLITGPEGNSYLFNYFFEGNKINCLPRGQSFKSDLSYIAGYFEAGSSLNLAVTAVRGSLRWAFADSSALLPSDVIDFAMLPAQRFWREKVWLLDFMWQFRLRFPLLLIHAHHLV